MKDARTPEPRRIRDVDSAARALRIKALAWAFVGSLPFHLITFSIGARSRSPLLVTGTLSLAVFGTIYFISLFVGEMLGRSAGGLYFAGGGSTPARREYSLAESLIVRGRLDDAVTELERAAALYPADPEPALKLARLLRDQCDRPEDAVAWFRTALERSDGVDGAEITAAREIIEIYTHNLRTPTRALPYLARLASRYGDTPTGIWARGEMGEIRQAMQEEEDA